MQNVTGRPVHHPLVDLAAARLAADKRIEAALRQFPDVYDADGFSLGRCWRCHRPITPELLTCHAGLCADCGFDIPEDH